MLRVPEWSFHPSLSELLSLPVFQGSRVLAGHAGLEHPVTGINLSDTPEYYKWLSPGELMVSTCFALHDNPGALADFIPTLSSKGLSGLILKPGQYLGSTPKVMLACADQLAFPLVELPESVRFSDITKAVSDELLRRQTALLRSTLTVNEMLTRTIVEGAGLEEITRMVSGLTGGSILVLDCINNRRARFLTETDATRFSGHSEEQIDRALIAGSEMHVLRVGGHSFGFLYVYHSLPPIEALDDGIMAQVLQTIPLEIARERTVRERGDQHFDEFLLHLLSDHIADEHREAARARAFGLDLSQNHLILRARVIDRSDTNNKYAGVFQRTLLASDVQTTLTNLGFSLHLVTTSDEYLLLLSAPLENRAFTALTTRFPERVDRYMEDYDALSIIAGCGRPHSGIAGLVRSDRESRLAFRASLSRGGGLTRFEDLGLLRLVYASEPEAEIDTFVHETLRGLLDHSQPRSSELLQTLESYFRNYGNLKRISEEMYAHYNTVVYRLKSIREITGLDVHIPAQRFQLELALQLYRLTTLDH
ncbi:PucR family transcriptional regulator [Flavonifractor hominis]|uniref:PucR family transcriptional regulator ligand-binding domain-containing protein n=1 Tax=Flavonifractor hominis TaxID=3133178 RepID=A0ABV1EL79_9FIRM